MYDRWPCAHDLSQRRALFPFSVSLVAGGKQDGGARAEVAGGDPAIGEAGERMELAGTLLGHLESGAARTAASASAWTSVR